MLTLNPDIGSQSLDRLRPSGLLHILRRLTDHGLDRGRHIEILGEQSVLETMTITLSDHEETLVVSRFATKIGHTMTEEHHTSRTT